MSLFKCWKERRHKTIVVSFRLAFTRNFLLSSSTELAVTCNTHPTTVFDALVRTWSITQLRRHATRTQGNCVSSVVFLSVSFLNLTTPKTRIWFTCTLLNWFSMWLGYKFVFILRVLGWFIDGKCVFRSDSGWDGSSHSLSCRRRFT